MDVVMKAHTSPPPWRHKTVRGQPTSTRSFLLFNREHHMVVFLKVLSRQNEEGRVGKIQLSFTLELRYSLW